jgi:hypothetical protein
MNPITYSLRADQPRSDQYYRDIAAFTDEVLAQADPPLGALVAAFQEAGFEAARTRPEYIFELLTLGVFWRVYAGRALNLSRSPQRMMSALARWRERGGPLRPVIDALRGSLATLFLAQNGSPGVPDTPSLAHLQASSTGWMLPVILIRKWTGCACGRRFGPVSRPTMCRTIWQRSWRSSTGSRRAAWRF